MNNSFDEKVYDYIKNNSGGGGETSFPIGTRLKISQGNSPPETGTWNLVGVYGTYTWTDNDITHRMDFLGTTIIDSARGNVSLDENTSTSWDYDSVLGSGNYTVTNLFGSLFNSKAIQSDYNMYAGIYNGNTTYGFQLEDNTITFTAGNTKGGVGMQARIVVTDPSQISITSGLTYEYERTE